MMPFLEIPIWITNSEGKEKQTVARIRPSNIDYYYPGYYQGTVIVMQSGASMLCVLSYDTLDEALKLYDREVKSKTGKFGNMSVVSNQPIKPIKE